MPKVNLRQSFVENPPIPQKAKADYFDMQLTGFLLEVRSSGTCTYYLRYRDKSSRIKQLRIGRTDSMTVEQARERARTLKSNVLMGFDPMEHVQKIKKIPTFKEFTRDRYLPYAQTYKRSWEYDKSLIEQRMMRIWGHKKMNEVQTGDLLELQNVLVRQGLKPGSVNRIMTLAKYIFNLAERWEVIDKAPTRNISKLQDDGARERYLSPEELDKLLDELENCQSKVVPDIIKFLILTGARLSEAVNLPWSELDMDNGIWTLPAARNKAKTKKTMPLSEGALKILSRRKDNGSAFVFPNPETGKPYQHLHGTWDRIRTRAGMPDLRIHDLRHSFASFLINSGHSLYEIQKLLGHADISTTQRYSHLLKSTLKNAADTVSNLCHRVG